MKKYGSLSCYLAASVVYELRGKIQTFHYGCPNEIIIDLIQEETISLNVGRRVSGPVGGVGRPQPPVLRGHQKFLLGAAEAAQPTT